MTCERVLFNGPLQVWKDELLPTDHTDQSGRPIVDLEAPQEAVNKAEIAGVDLSLRRIKYNDSRFGLMANWGSLRPIASRWGEVLAGFAWINKACSKDEVPAAGNIEAGDFLRLCEIGSFMPPYGFLRRENQIARYGELPEVVSGIAKISRGFLLVAEHLVAKDPHQLITPEGIYQIADKERLFNNQVGKNETRACPGSQKLVIESGRVLLFGGDFKSGVDVFDETFPDSEKLVEFSEVFVNCLRNQIELEGLDLNSFPFAGRIKAMLLRSRKTQLLEAINDSERNLNRILGWDTIKSRNGLIPWIPVTDVTPVSLAG